ncbi:alpha/beta fold hydrolase [Microbacterium aquimaris]|uniref:Alpha/beta hydrolase n=1 Tax=Microbacterium aquimaris TaxID=459816 RepID=A0ABU5N6V8_9MICO|nr:alpha/beta hydrolase [Microbacterium aquimaris]MDZ8161829.1 alpha/beta hydrolase [Microbacterium aquimaris]
MTDFTIADSTRFLTVPGGRIAFEVCGGGPLVVLVPGMGELRSSYRHLAPLLVRAGYRVVLVDLRGHGDSDADFPEYGDTATARDLIALVRHLGEPATIVGNSMGAGAAVIAASEHPELVEGLVLVGPFVRNAPTNPVMTLLFRVMTASAWVVPVWRAYMPKLYAGDKPTDFQAYRDSVTAAMRRPGHARAFSRTTRTDHGPAERCLGSVDAPALVIMGELDPDFPDPKAEADDVARALAAPVVMVPNAGHYPHAQQPESTASAIVGFLGGGRHRA